MEIMVTKIIRQEKSCKNFAGFIFKTFTAWWFIRASLKIQMVAKHKLSILSGTIVIDFRFVERSEHFSFD